MTERADDRLEDLGALGRAIQEIRAGLKPGGPEVDEAALYAYLAGALPEREQKIVSKRIETWQPWYNAYWKLCTDVDTAEFALHQTQPETTPVDLQFVKSITQSVQLPGLRQPAETAGEHGLLETRMPAEASSWQKIRATIAAARDEIARYLGTDLDSLNAEFGRYLGTEVCHAPISPYMDELRRVICVEWNWASRRNDPVLADPERCTEAVLEALIQANVQVPFPLPLVASFLVKSGLDVLCDLD